MESFFCYVFAFAFFVMIWASLGFRLIVPNSDWKFLVEERMWWTTGALFCAWVPLWIIQPDAVPVWAAVAGNVAILLMVVRVRRDRTEWIAQRFASSFMRNVIDAPRRIKTVELLAIDTNESPKVPRREGVIERT
jgi:hypothetical protein